MKFQIKLSFLNKESKVVDIIADYPYEAINKALYCLGFVERNIIKGVSIEKFK